MRTLKSSMRLAILTFAALSLGGCDALMGTSGEGDGADAAVEAGVSIMEAFGVQSELGPPTGADGQPLPDNFNPLGRKVTTLGAKREVFLAGVSYHVPAHEEYVERRTMLLDDGKAEFAPLWSESDTSDTWVENPLASAACDIDGDGLQEALTVYFKKTGGGSIGAKSNPGSAYLTYVDYDQAGEAYSRSDPVKIAGAFDLTTRDSGDAPYLMSLACGDTDGDGLDELALAVGNTLLVLDDQVQAFAPIFGPLDYRGGVIDDGKLHVTRIAAGDINGDAADEFVVIDGVDDSATCNYYVYGGAPIGEIVSNAISNGTESLQFGTVALGDIDGDRRIEAVFAGDDPGGGDGYNVLAASWKNGKLAFFPTTYHADRDWGDHRLVALRAFNPDGLEENARASLVVHEKVLAYVPDEGKFTVRYSLPGLVRNSIATGDVIGNRRDQVLLENNNDLLIWGLKDNGDWGEVAKLDIDTEGGTYLAIVAADVDGDSPVVQYTGRHELRFPDPQIVAAIASPPYWNDVQFDQQILGNCGTDFSKSTTEGSESSNSFSVSAGFSIGVSFEAPLFGKSVASSEMKATFTASMDYRTAKSRTTSIERGYSCPPTEDQVIITCIPFDVYYYKVLSSPVASDVGSEFPINIPREPQIIPLEREYFNQLNQGREQIDANVLAHQIGNPKSYASKAAVRALIDAADGNYLWDPTGQTVGVSNGLSWDAVTQEETESQTIGGGIGFSFETETVAGGVLFGSQLGFEYSYDATVSTGEGTTIRGAVPNLPPGTDLANYMYQYGIAAYKAGRTYFVVTYWVQ